MVSSPERIHHDGGRAAGAYSATTPSTILQIVSQSVESALKEVASSASKVAGKVSFDGLANKTVPEERLTSRIEPTHASSSDRPVDLVCSQLAGVLALAEGTILRLFGDAGRARELEPDTKVLAAIHTIVNRSVMNIFQSNGLKRAMRRRVYKWHAEPHSEKDVATGATSLSGLKVPAS